MTGGALRLSPHFTLTELTKSQTALRRGIANTPDAEAIGALRHLCVTVLEPVRDAFDHPVVISSGYRAAALNRAIGGAADSQHMRGEAADIEVPGISNAALAAFIRDSLPFDQLILEQHVPGDPASGWVHVSASAQRQRRQVLTQIAGTRRLQAGLIL